MLRYEELPAETTGRTLCLFAHFDRDNVVDESVVYYLEALHRLGAAIVFVSASPTLTTESIDAIRPYCVGVYCNETPSRDFGSWHTAWCVLREHGWSLQQFDRLVLTNDSVYGPLFALDEMWATFCGADMYGAIESDEHILHLQSWLLAFDLNEKTREFVTFFWDEFFTHTADKGMLIWKYEIGMSMLARENGLTTKAFVSSDSAEDAYKKSMRRPLRCANKTIDFWDELIVQFKFPFLKRLVATRCPLNLDEFIDTHTDYPSALLRSHQNRWFNVKVGT